MMMLKLAPILPVLIFLFGTSYGFSTSSASLKRPCAAFSSHGTTVFAPGTISTTTRRERTSVRIDAAPKNENGDRIVTDDSKSDSVICGGGPAGLLSAIMLAQKFPNKNVQVFDRLSAPPSPTDESVWSDVARFYLIGLGSRGQKALAKFGVWEDVKACSTTVLGRKDWSPESKSEEGVERIFTDRPFNTEVLPRDKLVGVLHRHILENYSHQIQLNYGKEVYPVDFGEEGSASPVVLRVSDCKVDTTQRSNPASSVITDNEDDDKLCDVDNSYTHSTNLLIAADGTSRTVASRMEEIDSDKRSEFNILQKLCDKKSFKVTKYVDDNQRVYKTIPLRFPEGWRPDLNYSARTKDGRVTFDALPADARGNYCGVLLLKADDDLAAANTNPEDLRDLLDQSLPQFSSLVDDDTLDTIAKKSPSFLPSFRYAGPRLYQGDKTILLGDCAHTVKPYFGLGANSALEDVQILSEIIDTTSTLPEAVHAFSKNRAGESQALVQLSRELDRPGKLGFVTFVLPLILDSIFHGLAPKIFAPNTIAMLQREGVGFRGVRKRKAMDRTMQVLVLGSVAGGSGLGARVLFRTLMKLSNRSAATVAGGVFAFAAVVGFGRKAAFYLNPSLEPADVLAKTKDSLTGSETFLVSKGKGEEK